MKDPRLSEGGLGIGALVGWAKFFIVNFTDANSGNVTLLMPWTGLN